jgi:hypothetical protein
MARADEAITVLTEFIKVAGASTAEDELTLAEAYLAKGDKSSAGERLKAAAKLISPDDTLLQERLKKLQAAVAAGGAN